MILFADLEYLARTVYGEARGESDDGKVAVACVILNRVNGHHRRETRIAGVATEPMQFSCWNENDPNLKTILSVDLSDPVFMDCVRASIEAIDRISVDDDPTFGSEHYHTAGVSPHWSEGVEPVVTIGNHLFFDNIA